MRTRFETNADLRVISELNRATRLRRFPADSSKMSLFRYLTADPWSEFRSVPTLFDQDFGRGMKLSDLVQPMFDHMRSVYLRPWRHIAGQHSGTSDIQMDKDSFKVVIDVQQFAPNEITVKSTDDQVLVEGKHEEKQDAHGYISRHFVRRYRLPKGVQADAVTSTLSSDGVLTVSVPRNPPLEDGNVRIIPITMTEAPAIKRSSGERERELSWILRCI